MDVADSIRRVREVVAEAAWRSGRSPAEVRLMGLAGLRVITQLAMIRLSAVAVQATRRFALGLIRHQFH